MTIVVFKFKPKIGDELITRKPNKPLGLTNGDYYGKIINITDDDYVVERFDGEIKPYSKVYEEEVFFKWFEKK